jgi:hypothetical protein
VVHLPFAYVGPGAGFAFLGSFFSILLSLLAGIASLLLWPFRAMLRLFRRGKNVRARVILLGLDGLDPDLVEKLMTAGKLPNLEKLRSEGSYRRIRAAGSGGWATPGFWKILGEHAVDSTVLLVPGVFPAQGIRGRLLCRTAGGQIVSQPSYYVKYLARLLGRVTVAGMPVQDQEALFFSALDHQKRGVLACVFEMTESAEAICREADRIAGRLLPCLDRNTTVFIVSHQGILFSNRELDPDGPAMEDLAPTVLRVFGIQPPEGMEGKPVIRFA